MEDLRPLRLLPRGHVRSDGRGERGVPDQADELPLPLPDVQGQHPELSRLAAPMGGGAGHRLPLRAQRSNALLPCLQN